MPTLECPTCHRIIPYADRTEVPCRPFCSERCKLIDLGKWLNEEYRVSEERPDLYDPNESTPETGEEGPAAG